MYKTTLVIAALLLLLATPCRAASIDNSLYAELLADHVKNGLVDYKGLMADKPKLERYLDVLSEVDTAPLSREEAFAYYINVYNAFTLKLILDNYPGIDSIKDIGTFFKGPWSMEIVTLRDRTVNLDEVEHEIMRPRFEDPRLHFVVNCASMGCPRLHDEPFEAATLDATLDDLTRANINAPAFNSFRGGTLRLIRVFDWFEEDWGADAAKIAFVRKYAEGGLKRSLDAWQGEIEVEYTDWDWSLNDAK